MVRYVPKSGDIVALTFDPQAGHEQKGRRPALIVSNELFNRHVGMAFACPITRTDRGFPFHVPFQGENVYGFVMVEQLKSIDYRARKVKYIETVDQEILERVLTIVESIL